MATILIVEDDRDLRSMFADVLSFEGHDPIVARDGIEALVMLARHRGPVDLIVLDQQMPGLDGVGFADRYREYGGNLPILAVSSYEARAFAERIQADAWLEKPFGIDSLLGLVMELCPPIRSDLGATHAAL